MQIYVEYVLIDNFFIDYMILSTAFYVQKEKYVKIRLILSSLLGALFSLLYPLLSLPNLLLILLKVCIGLIMLFIAKKFSSVKKYVISAFIFFGTTFLLGGAMTGLSYLFGVNFSEWFISLLFLPVYVVVKIIKIFTDYFYQKKKTEEFCLDIEITILGVSKKGKGFIDTGNSLYNGNSPCVIASKKFIKDFCGIDFYKNLKKISFSTIEKYSTLFAIKCERLTIYNGNAVNTYNNVTVCVADNTGIEYDVLLHRDFLFKE